jgi:hypothetical protein
MSPRRLPVDSVRSALRDLKSKTAEVASASPTWDRVLTVREHEGALDPTRPIVIGDRGTGKSFWTGALLDNEERGRLSRIYPRLRLDNVRVVLGFGADEFTSEHPTSSELVSLLAAGHDAEAIWRTVILSLSPIEIRPEALKGDMSWADRVTWVASDPALRRKDFQELDGYLANSSQRLLVIFDALDTMASQWTDIAKLMRGLLQAGLFLRSSRSLRIKMFLRPDMADDPSLWAVGDSSKLRHDEVTLAWTRRDLHALLAQYLANHAETRNAVHEYCSRELKEPVEFISDRYEVPTKLVADEIEQQKFFASVAGDYMGANATKGRTYTWVPNHLANARGYAAPRSFLLALGVAAEHSRSNVTALDVQGIQEGVRQASRSRMSELREDYRWIDAVFRPLRDMLVPMERRELVNRWREQKVVSSIYREMEADQSGRYLPPPRIGSPTDDPSTHAALIETLDHLAIVETTGDGRLNMPDLFRLAAGVKRMGGVKLRP